MKTHERVDHSALLDELAKGIEDLTSSQKWQDYLEVQARFHHYSAGNCQLIAMQSGGYATQVAGFNTWKALGRHVKKGERGLYILAPLAFKSVDETTGEETYGVKGFRYVAVFDVAQTEGDEMPAVATKLLGTDPDGLYARLVEFAGSIGFSVTDHDFEGYGVNGDCNHATTEIRVETSNSGAQRLKTLAHELSHAVLHDPEASPTLTREVKELEAESSAFVICKALGVDSDEYSFGYVAGWLGGGEAAVRAIKASQERIHRASATVLRALEGASELAAVAA